MQLSFDAFFVDPRLSQLSERLRIADDVLEIISIGENQHSDLLAWMFDSREGHAQGDEILKDLLLAASVRANASDGHLDGRSETAQFFKDWSPSRIRTTSFASSFIVRELVVIAGSRIDLFVVDPQNQFIVVIENKKGGSLTTDQLDRYRDAISSEVQNHQVLKHFRRVFLALKKDLELLDEDEQQPSPFWLALDYEWLDQAAKRAAHQVSRGNAAAGLVMSYCQQQTGWESSVDKEVSDLAIGLCLDYSDEIGKLVKLGGRPEKKWFAAMDDAGLSDDVWCFVLQNRSLIEKLCRVHGFAAIKGMLLKAMPGFPADSIEHKRVWLDLCPRGGEVLEVDWWAAHLNIHHSKDDKFNLDFCWNTKNLPAGVDSALVRDEISKVIPELSKWPDSSWRRVRLKSSLTKSELAKSTVEYEGLISGVFRAPAIRAIVEAI